MEEYIYSFDVSIDKWSPNKFSKLKCIRNSIEEYTFSFTRISEMLLTLTLSIN